MFTEMKSSFLHIFQQNKKQSKSLVATRQPTSNPTTGKSNYVQQIRFLPMSPLAAVLNRSITFLLSTPQTFSKD